MEPQWIKWVTKGGNLFLFPKFGIDEIHLLYKNERDMPASYNSLCIIKTSTQQIKITIQFYIKFKKLNKMKLNKMNYIVEIVEQNELHGWYCKWYTSPNIPPAIKKEKIKKFKCVALMMFLNKVTPRFRISLTQLKRRAGNTLERHWKRGTQTTTGVKAIRTKIANTFYKPQNHANLVIPYCWRSPNYRGTNYAAVILTKITRKMALK